MYNAESLMRLVKKLGIDTAIHTLQGLPDSTKKELEGLAFEKGRLNIKLIKSLA